MEKFALVCYVVAVIIAVVIIVGYALCSKSDIRHSTPNKTVSNTGEPMGGGKKHFKEYKEIP